MGRESIRKAEGPELHRLKAFVNYNPEDFNKMYIEVKPLINSLSYQINLKLFNVSRDIIKSYFEDKFLYVYNKYQADYDHSKLKGVIIKSLKTFKNKLLSKAYGEEAKFNLNTARFEDMKLDRVKEEGEEEEEDMNPENDDWDIEDEPYDEDRDLLKKAIRYIKNSLTEDEYLIFTIEMDPSEYFKRRMVKSRGRLTVEQLIEFFELPHTRKSREFITRIRRKIKKVIEEAKYHI